MISRPRLLAAGLVLAGAIALAPGASADISGAGPDENTSQAYGPLQLGVSYPGAFASQSDVDYLAFVVASAGQTIQFTVANTTKVCQDPYDAGCPVYATLMDSTGQSQVGGSDSAAGTIATNGDTETFDWTFAQPGTYYVLMESDGDLSPGNPSYAIQLAGVGGGGGAGTGSPGGSGPSGAGKAAPALVRALEVLPRQRGRAVKATVVLGKPAAWLRGSLLLTQRHRAPSVVVRRLYLHLARGRHHVVLPLPLAVIRKLAPGQRLPLLLRILVARPRGAARVYTRHVTLVP